MVINTIILTFAASQKKQENLYKIYITMTKNNSMNLEGMSYETPSVNVLNVMSEGVLCGSFDSDNRTELFDRLEMEEL